jgi:hypothetical protein
MSSPDPPASTAQPLVYVINGMPIPNVLVQNVWRLMFGWNLYRNWYCGQGAFVVEHPEVQMFVRSYFREVYPTVAVATLCSATERLLRTALKSEQVSGPTLRKTLPHLLKFCVSADQKYFNILGACCDARSINRINAIRKGAEHGDHTADQNELSRSGRRPDDAEYLKIIDHRLVVPHQQLCGIFNRVDPETGLFTRDWKPREYEQCEMPGSHDKDGLLPPEAATYKTPDVEVQKD